MTRITLFNKGMYTLHLKLNHMMGKIASRYKYYWDHFHTLLKDRQLHFGNISISQLASLTSKTFFLVII